jgi:predicted nucleic acid-binding protein
LDYLLDTNVLIDLRDGEPQATASFAALDGRLLVSVVSRVELENGVYRDPLNVALRRARLDALLPAFQVLPFDDDSVAAYRGIVEALGYSRRKMLDRMIAAQALVHRAALVTCNGDDLREVPGLQLLEW